MSNICSICGGRLTGQGVARQCSSCGYETLVEEIAPVIIAQDLTAEEIAESKKYGYRNGIGSLLLAVGGCISLLNFLTIRSPLIFSGSFLVLSLISFYLAFGAQHLHRLPNILKNVLITLDLAFGSAMFALFFWSLTL